MDGIGSLFGAARQGIRRGSCEKFSGGGLIVGKLVEPTKLILAGEVVCVDDAEAERLVKLGVAAEAELDAETKAIVEQADADSNDVETQEEASEAEEKPGRKGRKTAAE